ncbi:30S ribosomal protein S4 [Caldilinea sp.]|jgi:small subunit ribosomal protein S4|uniref:30S ribosomal protein S4 n=2 Tax=Caldilinea TaxID=233191 RepID=UPI002FDE16F7
MNYTGPKVKLSRRLGVPLTPKAARIMQRRPYPPGQHGKTQKGRRKRSDYGHQLLEKQKLRAQYNIHERQMRNYVARAMRKSGVTGEVLVQLLESRLDAFVLRAGFVNTIYAARQFVSHGHVHVDGRPVNLPGYQLKPGQIVTVKEKSRRMPLVQESLSNAHPPAYVTLDKDAFSAQLARLPQPDEAPILCDLQLVIEYYSR